MSDLLICKHRQVNGHTYVSQVSSHNTNLNVNPFVLQLIHPSGAERMQKDIPACVRVDMIERCGHSVNMDRPGQVVKVLLQFRGELEQTVANGFH